MYRKSKYGFLNIIGDVLRRNDSTFEIAFLLLIPLKSFSYYLHDTKALILTMYYYLLREYFTLSLNVLLRIARY